MPGGPTRETRPYTVLSLLGETGDELKDWASWAPSYHSGTEAILFGSTP
jgi:hypothetical protein